MFTEIIKNNNKDFTWSAMNEGNVLTYPVISSTLAIRSSLTIFSAFFVAKSSLFSMMRFSTSLPMP